MDTGAYESKLKTLKKESIMCTSELRAVESEIDRLKARSKKMLGLVNIKGKVTSETNI